jgi:uncharacterized protein YhfF
LPLCVIVIILHTDVAGPKKDTRKRKYQEDFTELGFTSIVTNGDGRPQCVICCEMLANELLNVNKSM